MLQYKELPATLFILDEEVGFKLKVFP